MRSQGRAGSFRRARETERSGDSFRTARLGVRRFLLARTTSRVFGSVLGLQRPRVVPQGRGRLHGATPRTGDSMGLTEDTAAGLLGLDVLPHSAVSVAGAEIGLARPGPRVAVLAPSGSPVISRFRGKSSAIGGLTLLLGPTSRPNLDALRDLMPWL